MATKRSFYIIDGHAQIYRAYFAPFRDLTSPTGEPTKATFVFTQMLLNLVETRKPDYLAMVIDAAGDEGVFRKQIDPNYKATRKARPDDFGPQEARILQICRDAGLPIYFVPRSTRPTTCWPPWPSGSAARGTRRSSSPRTRTCGRCSTSTPACTTSTPTR